MKYSNLKLISNTAGTDKKPRATCTVDMTYKYGLLWLFQKTEIITVHAFGNKAENIAARFWFLDSVGENAKDFHSLNDLAYVWYCKYDESIFESKHYDV